MDKKQPSTRPQGIAKGAWLSWRNALHYERPSIERLFQQCPEAATISAEFFQNLLEKFLTYYPPNTRADPNQEQMQEFFQLYTSALTQLTETLTAQDLRYNPKSEILSPLIQYALDQHQVHNGIAAGNILSSLRLSIDKPHNKIIYAPVTPMEQPTVHTIEDILYHGKTFESSNTLSPPKKDGINLN